MTRQLLKQFGDDGRTFAHVKLRFFGLVAATRIGLLCSDSEGKRRCFTPSCGYNPINQHQICMRDSCIITLLMVFRLQTFGSKFRYIHVHA